MEHKVLISKERLRRAALLVLPPFTAFYLMQFVLGALPWEMAPGVVLANGLCIGGAYFLLWAATGHPAVCCVLLHLACGLWGTANYFVSLYRGTPVLPWDLTALETAAAVSGSYSYVPTEPMLVGAVLVLHDDPGLLPHGEEPGPALPGLHLPVRLRLRRKSGHLHPAARSCGGGKIGGGHDPVPHDPVGPAPEGRAALHRNDRAARAPDVGPQGLQKALEIHDLRFPGGVGDGGGTLGAHRGQHGVLGGSHTGQGEDDVRALQPSGTGQTALPFLHCAAQGADGSQM